MSLFVNKIIKFNQSLKLDIVLPENIRVMNPFKENPEALNVSSAFYKKYYSDKEERQLILAINPGRYGAGVTGIPFTDTKRLEQKCGLTIKDVSTHEPSSVFVYQMIDSLGGVEQFYSRFFINSVCPLGFVRTTSQGREVNYNYYDGKELLDKVMPFAIWAIGEYIKMGCSTDMCYCMGTGKNYKILKQINEEHRFFKKIVPLEHPRYIIQYKSKELPRYINKYAEVLGSFNRML